MNRILRSLAALLVALALLTGCSSSSIWDKTEERKEQRLPGAPRQTEGYSGVTNADLQYIRPNLQELEALKEAVITCAAEGSLRETIDAVYDFYDAYDWFYTHYALADIRYSSDMTDEYWEGEYTFCMDAAPRVDATLEDIFYALADSPLRDKLESNAFFGEGFFDSYTGENLWDEEFLRLMEAESELISRYYELSGEPLGRKDGDNRWGGERARILVDLISVRKAMAASWGYDSYAEFAWDFSYDRDFTPGEVMEYYAEIRRELVPLYRETADSGAWDGAYYPAKEEQSFQYVRTAARNMGGTVWDAFVLLEEGGLYDIAWNRNKYTASFVYYLTGYGVPFVFVNPQRECYDHLVFAHEFGHFCSDYAAGGSEAGIDVGEIFSQGMEYLSLSYGDAPESLVQAKLADCLSTYVEQAAYGSFEQRMYDLEGADLSPEGLCKLYDEVAREFGFDAIGYDSREFVEVNHFYTNPMYVVSYVLSNDAALQLYRLELEDTGTGAALLQKHLATDEARFMTFLEEAGMESPFAPGRMAAVADFLEAGLT